MFDLLPTPDWLVRLFARPYVAGDSLNAGLATAERLLESGVLTTLDLLAEGIRTDERVQENIRVYEDMVDGVAERFDNCLLYTSPSPRDS